MYCFDKKYSLVVTDVSFYALSRVDLFEGFSSFP